MYIYQKTLNKLKASDGTVQSTLGDGTHSRLSLAMTSVLYLATNSYLSIIPDMSTAAKHQHVFTNTRSYSACSRRK